MPQIIECPERHYIGIRKSITMTTFHLVADRIGELYGWLAARGTPPAGGPFFRYLVIDMDGDLVVEAGVPVHEPVPGEGDIIAGTLPAGRYVQETHVGHPDQLVDVTDALLRWAREQGLSFAMSEQPDGQHWDSRLEFYHTNPEEQPDMTKWEIELQFGLA
ncbi:GyrI-like domain-containing protein [Nonomuraea sp. SBT364]|uniref:GyrI-like domain-containing protein n=1 Tax=Nonomuraea sp. SBT364 TaxID=1580530 RepID=UPI00066E3CA4|nr:GyrI-like domain-containing protein [Nonomuraea sp. SBT364]